MFSLLLPLIYLSFITLGLPDGLLGAAWPVMYPMLGVNVSASGIVFMIIALGTVVSSLISDRFTSRFGTASITFFSAAITALSLFGFGFSRSFLSLCFWAIPYGLGAGGVDACLNNYVAIHYESKHMSWLHCMWGIGATVGPYIMGAVLSGNGVWTTGYRLVACVQLVMAAVLFFTRSAWTRGSAGAAAETPHRPLTMKEILAIPGAWEIMVAFFCYCALEQTAGLWAASYLVLDRGIHPDTAASFASMFYLGITLGRFINGFIAMKLSDNAMIRIGFGIIGGGIALMLLPLGNACALAGFVVIGLGCAPIYPCIIHSTPENFGMDNSQSLVGVQMASAYTGILLVPPFFGWLANTFDIRLMPWYLLAILVLMWGMYGRMKKKTA